MSKIPDPMEGLRSFQQMLDTGIHLKNLGTDYLGGYDEAPGRKRYSFAKVVDGEVQSLATFGQEDPINGVENYSINYSVSEKYRGRGLAVEVANKGIEELAKIYRETNTKSFRVDAIIDLMNTHSIKVAKKLFPGPGIKTKDHFTGIPSLYFVKLIVIQQ
ncbi:MAG: hypothetical protein IPM57_03135 [Oligoflexia bacterium]|nr:hypothetical protein [Oligoflexia bacterium]